VLSKGHLVWIKNKKKVEQWTIEDPNYIFLGNKFIKLKKDGVFLIKKIEDIHYRREDVK